MLLDRVFGPTTTTRHVYDVAAQHVVNGAMEGINGKQNRYPSAKELRFLHSFYVYNILPLFLHALTGTIFAYGVTSSGKTHTMHVRFYYLRYFFVLLLRCIEDACKIK
jgi:centromeric protein E